MSAPRDDGPHHRPPGLRRRALAALPLAALLRGQRSEAAAEPLEVDEDVLFLPGVARPLDNGQFDIDIHAWIHEKDRNRLLDMGLARYLGLDLGTMSPAARVRFAHRTALFHAESEEDKVIEIDFGHDVAPVAMPASDASGRTNLRATVSVDADPGAAPWLRFHAKLPSALRRVEGRALIVPEQGLSVVSDIDDTIKRTQVRNQREMMLNTFARPFEAAPGMAGHYRLLARDPRTRFHYVSSSPIQLLPPLADFMRHAGFPPGSIHLRESTTLRTLIPGADASRQHKLSTIQRLMDGFEQRQFLLVGDSGELDPEIYGELARSQPQRVQGIVIRDVTQEGRGAERYASAFEGIDPARWHVYVDGATWPASTS